MSHSHLSAEHEVILLRAALELIDEMVNFAILDLLGSDPESQILFHTHIHQRYFNVVLVDFLSRTDRKVPVAETSFLSGLRNIVQSPQFSIDNSHAQLASAVNEMSEWLDTTVDVEVWLPTVNVETTLVLSRLKFLKLCGNISKHSFLRSSGPAQELRDLLRESGCEIDPNMEYLALGDFYERFHTDILNYHAGTISEFLNNIRWGIYSYLHPTHKKSIRYDSNEAPRYTYDVPKDIGNEFSRVCFWDLMNSVRSKPSMRQFRVTKWLKQRY